MVYYVHCLSNCFRVCFSFCKDLQKGGKKHCKIWCRPSDFVRYSVTNVNTERLDTRWVDHEFCLVLTDDKWFLESTKIYTDYNFKKNCS
jgi:hypothetical protein